MNKNTGTTKSPVVIAEDITRKLKAIAADPRVTKDVRASHSTTIATNLMRAVVRDLKAAGL